jgi:hypothetical protein
MRFLCESMQVGYSGELGRKHTERENEILQTGEREGENIDGERERMAWVLNRGQLFGFG